MKLKTRFAWTKNNTNYKIIHKEKIYHNKLKILRQSRIRLCMVIICVTPH